jgi:hypothetical protein
MLIYSVQWSISDAASQPLTMQNANSGLASRDLNRSLGELSAVSESLEAELIFSPMDANYRLDR